MGKKLKEESAQRTKTLSKCPDDLTPHKIVKTISYGGTVPKPCLFVTWGLCAGGVILGLGLLLAGGIGRHHYSNLQSLMYIGILLFAVSLLLLVIFCSSFGVFTVLPRPEQLRQPDPCLCHVSASKFNSPHVQYDFPLEGNFPSWSTCTCYRQQDGPFVVPFPLVVQDCQSNATGKELQNCVVKNCICLTKDAEAGNNRGTRVEAKDIPFVLNKALNPQKCVCCHPGPVSIKHSSEIPQNKLRLHVQNTPMTHTWGVNNVSPILPEDLLLPKSKHHHLKRISTRGHKMKGITRETTDL